MVVDASELKRRRGNIEVFEERARYLDAPTLTARESDILRLIAAGRENSEIAVELHFSLGTIKMHVRDILAKLDASSRTEAAVRAVRLAMI